MLLTSVASIRETLGFDDMTDINDAIESGLAGATPVLAAALATQFDRTEVTDLFHVYEPTVQSGSLKSTEFRLSRGFLLSDPVITFKNSSLTVDADNFRYNLEKGVVRDIGTGYADTFVEITYTCGFETVDPQVGDFPVFKPDQVPTWLQEAAKMQTYVNIANSAPVTSAGIVLDVDEMQRRIQNLLLGRIRYAPMALIPV